jgi:multimeric flavodoxin WrbA
MKIVVILGSPRKMNSYDICKMIEEKFSDVRQITFEYLHIASMNIKECKGCGQCLKKGEQYCPIIDDVSYIKEQLLSADGIIFSSPVYTCHVTSVLKKLIDRLAYLFHRPELIGKPAINVITTAGGAKKVTRKYLRMTACGFGCHLVGTISIISPMFFQKNDYYNLYNEKYNKKMNGMIDKVVSNFHRAIINDQLPKPTFYDIYMFNGLKSKTYMSDADYNFWKEKGWLNSNYYYKTKINIVKKFFGYSLCQLIKMTWKRIQK